MLYSFATERHQENFMIIEIIGSIKDFIKAWIIIKVMLVYFKGRINIHYPWPNLISPSSRETFFQYHFLIPLYSQAHS